MPNTNIMEDETLVIKEPPNIFLQVSEEENIKAILNSVKENIEYITRHHDETTVFNETCLSHGLSFALLIQPGIKIPVIFLQNNAGYPMTAIENNDNGYAGKWSAKVTAGKTPPGHNLPVSIRNTIENKAIKNPAGLVKGRKKKRLLVKKGVDSIAVLMEDVVLIYTLDKMVYLVDRFAKKYISDNTLNQLEQELDSAVFFRANRQYVISINYIKSFKSHEKVKLLVNLAIPEIKHSIVISQQTAPLFRKWMHDA